jgi:hypothetical protein
VVHHAIPLETLYKYPNLFRVEEVNDLANLRGIPNELNPTTHLSTITPLWYTFFKNNATATRKKVLDLVDAIDRDHGHLFQPPHGGKK